MKSISILLVAMTVTAIPVTASAANNGGFFDRVEDRLDRIESRRDEAVDHGRRDVVEDRVDRWESRRDRANKDSPRFISRWERRSIKRRWQNAKDD